MGNNVKKRFTVSLDIETKDLEKQVKSTVGNLKTILADLGSASDKMGYFKELVDYIGQVDAALTALRAKNQDAFNHMFDGLDASLKKQLEDLFGISGVDLGKLDVLREKLATLTPKSSIKELKGFANEIDSLFKSIGAKSPFENIEEQFKGKANTKHIEILTDALSEFATVWDGVNKKIQGGFGVGGSGVGSGSGSGAGEVATFSAEVQKQIDELNKQIKELEEAKKKFDKVAKTVKTIKTKGDKAIPDSYKTELTVESVQRLMDEFDTLKVKLESGDKASVDYYNNLTRMTEVVLTLKRALSDVRADDSIKQMFMGAPGGRHGNMIGKLSSYANSALTSGIFEQVVDLSGKKNGIDSIINGYLSKIDALKSGNSGVQQSNQKTGMSYQDLKNKIQEYYSLVQQYNDESLDEDSIDRIADDMEKLEMVISKLGKGKEQVNDIIDALARLSTGNASFEGTVSTISKMLGIEDTSALIEQAKVKLQEFFSYANKFKTIESLEGIDLDKTVAELESARNELKKLSEQGVLTEQQMNEVATAFNAAKTNLSALQSKRGTARVGAGAGGGSGTGSGIGSSITGNDISSLENTIRSEISSLTNKLDSVLKVEVVKNNTPEIQSTIDGIKSSIDRISSYIDAYSASQGDAKNQAEINAMKGNLKQLLKYVSDFNAKDADDKSTKQELSAAIMSDGTISVGFGEKGTVPWDRMASSLVADLSKSLLVDVHSHPWSRFDNGRLFANDFFSGSGGDLGAFRFSKELGAQMAAMITGNIMRTLDISKLTESQMMRFRDSLADIEKRYANDPKYSKYMVYEDDEIRFRRQDTLAEQHKVTEAFESLMYKAFESIGFSKDKVDQEIFKKYNLSDDQQLTELAERLVTLSKASQNALSPVERLGQIISYFGGDPSSLKAKAAFEGYKKGELTAADVFNQLNGTNLGRTKYTISQDTMDSLYRIDTSHEISAVESLLTQITSILESISTGISNIDTNTRQDNISRLNSNISDVIDISNGIISPHLTDSIKSIFDPLNISEYKNYEVLKQTDMSIDDFQNSINKLFRDAYRGKLNIEELNSALNKFYTALSHTQDAMQQIELYESRTKEEVEYNGEVASEYLEGKHSQLVDYDELQKLLYLLSQAKIDINKTKDIFKEGLHSVTYDDDNGALVGHLQSIQSILDSIYGVLHGFTGIESAGKNSATYKQPTVDTNVAQKEFSEQDLSVLNSILQAIQNIVGYLQAHDVNKTPENVTKDDDDTSELVNFIKAKLPQQLASEDTLLGIKSIVDNLYNKLSQDETPHTESDDKDTENNQDSEVYQLLTSKLQKVVASEDTLLSLKGTLDQIAELLRIENGDSNFTESLNTLISALTENVTALKDIASGITQEQKVKKSDLSNAISRIADPAQNKQISDIAINSVGQLGSEVQIGNLKALSDGVVKVEGAFKNASGEWEGFTVKINESNKAVDFAIDKQSAFAKSLNNTTAAQNEAAKALERQVKTSAKDESTKLRGAFNALNFKEDDDLSGDAEKQSIANEYKYLSNILKQYSADASKVSQQELNDTLQRVSALHQEIEAYQKKYNLSKGKGSNGGKTYGLNQLQNFTARYNSLMSGASDVGLSDQAPIVANLANAYQRLQAAQSAFVKGEDLESDVGKAKVAEFKAAQLACNEYARELKKVVDASKNLASNSVMSETLSDDFADTIPGRQAALKDFVNTTYGSIATIGDFDKACNRLFFTVNNGDGTFTNMTASINDARTAIHATAGTIEKQTTVIGKCFNILWDKFKSIGTYFFASMGWQSILQQVRKGIEHVRQIDLALTELKKVTNETGAAYDNFLQKASKSAGVIGSTVADFTNATADFARLGYNISEAAELAKVASVYKNVGDGIENVEQASESIISTMKAFGIEANNAMGIVDRFNEVGKYIAQTT